MAPVTQVFKTVGQTVTNAVHLPQMLMSGAGIDPSVFGGTGRRSVTDPTQTVLGSPDQGVVTLSAPPVPSRYAARGLRRRRRGTHYGRYPPPEYASMSSGVPTTVAPVSPGYRPSAPQFLPLGGPLPRSPGQSQMQATQPSRDPSETGTGGAPLGGISQVLSGQKIDVFGGFLGRALERLGALAP